MENNFLYKRRSIDSEDKQILSLESQDRIIRETVAGFSNFKIIGDYEESKSAKAPGRLKFNEMCARLERGEGKNIICWQLNRLARNAIDGGRIIWLVQHYGVKIITPSKIYDQSDILLMYVEFAMSNQFITDLAKNSARGVEEKLRAGIAPIHAPLGYYNDIMKKQGLRDILPDPDRFDLVRKMWDLLLSGKYSPLKILDIVNNEWHLTQRNGKPISRTRIYEIFKTLFYTGQYEYVGKIYQGLHKPMITMDEYERAQKILGRKGKQGMTKHFFAFGGGIIRCSCGSSITAHERYRKICPSCHHKYNSVVNERCPKCYTEAPDLVSYFCYYHCTRKKDPACKQPHVKEDSLVKQFDEILSTISLPEEFTTWVLKQLEQSNKDEVINRGHIYKTTQEKLSSVSRKLDNLLTKYISEENKDGELINDFEYRRQKELLQEEKQRLEESLTGFSTQQNAWMDVVEGVFDFAKTARHRFITGTNEDRRVIAGSFGLNLTLDNKKLRLDMKKPFSLVQEASSRLKSPLDKFEPVMKIVREGQTYYFDPQNPVWGD